MLAQEIERYLAELGAALESQGITKYSTALKRVDNQAAGRRAV